MQATITIDREVALAEIRAAREGLKQADGSVFVGINNKGVLSDGSHAEGQSLLRIFTEAEWHCELKIYNLADLRVKSIEPFKGEVTQVVTIPELGDTPLQVRYYGLELNQDGCWGMGKNVLDPRAHIVPALLTETPIVWPFVYVYAEIKPVLDDSIVELSDANAKAGQPSHADEAVRVLAAGLLRDMSATSNSGYVEEKDSPERDGSTTALRAPPSPQQRRRRVPITDVSDDPAWSAPGAVGGSPSDGCAFQAMADHWDTEGTGPLKKPSMSADDEAMYQRLQIDAKQAAATGDHKAAYHLIEKAIALACTSSDRPISVAHEAEYAPAREEAPQPPSGMCGQPKTFKPVVSYKLANGQTHVIPAGLYTEDEFFARTLEAQDLVAATAKAQSESSLSVTAMSKYAEPLTRSESQCDSMASVERLRDEIADKAVRARSVMEASLSKEASPTQTAMPSPELNPEELIKLSDSVGNLKIEPSSGNQQAKWDAAGETLKQQAAALWGP